MPFDRLPTVLPPGDFALTRPIRVGPGGLRGAGARATTLRPAAGHSLPLVLAVHPDLDHCPVDPAGLRADGIGWLNLSDYLPNVDGSAAFTLDVTATLPAAVPNDSVLAAASGCVDGSTHVIPFALFVDPDGRLRVLVRTSTGAAQHATAPGAAGFGRQSRYVAQFGHGRLCLWVDGTLLIDEPCSGVLDWPLWCSLYVGEVRSRFPEGAGWLRSPAGTVYRALLAEGYARFTPAAGPTGPETTDSTIGVFTRFGGKDGCLFAGRYAGTVLALHWRANSYSYGGHEPHVADVSLDGEGRCPAGLRMHAGNNWRVRDVTVASCRIGIHLVSQCYGGTVDGGIVGNCERVGVALGNNSGLVTIRDLNVQASHFGIVATDSDPLVLAGGWVANSSHTGLLVTGDQCAVHATGWAVGLEGTHARHCVRLHRTAAAAFIGCAFTPLDSPIPAVELDDCPGTAFVSPRFGMHPNAVAAVSYTGPAPMVVAEGRRWAGGSDLVPLFPLSRG